MRITNISFGDNQKIKYNKTYEIQKKDGTVVPTDQADKIVKRNIMLTNSLIMPLTCCGLTSIFFHSKKDLKAAAGLAALASITIGYITNSFLKTHLMTLKNQSPKNLYKWGGYKVVEKYTWY